MAGRPPKESLDFAGWDTGIFDNDPKIDKLMDAQGCIGFVIYFYLCQKAYGSNGYYYSWCFDDSATTARKIGGGAGAKSVEETVRYCLQIGLFDKGLFDGWNILTSRGIQKRFRLVAKERTGNKVIQEYWLLKNEESAGLNFYTLNSNYTPPKCELSPPIIELPPPYSKVQYSIKDSTSPENADGVSAAGEVGASGGKKKRKYEKPVYTHDSKHYKAAKWLSDKLLSNPPRKLREHSETDLQNWANDFRLMETSDKLQWDDIRAVLMWCTDDSFWRRQILSATNFRNHYNRLVSKMNDAPNAPVAHEVQEYRNLSDMEDN